MTQDEAKKWEREKWLQSALIRLQENGEDARNRLKLASDIAVKGLNTLTLMNGGAIVALFALIAQGSDSKFVKAADPRLLLAAFAAFATGVFLTLVAIMVGYWSQQMIALYEQEIANQTYCAITSQPIPEVKFTETPNRLLVVAVVLAGLATLLFLAGSACALVAALAAVRQ